MLKVPRALAPLRGTLLSSAAWTVLGLGCASPGRPPAEDVLRGDSEPAGAVAPLEIPAAQLPGPGDCSIWIPGVPPSEQPHPVNCAQLDQVPLGAWVITRSDPKHLNVYVYDESRPEAIVSVRVYDPESGAFLGYRRM